MICTFQKEERHVEMVTDFFHSGAGCRPVRVYRNRSSCGRYCQDTFLYIPGDFPGDIGSGGYSTPKGLISLTTKEELN